MLFFYNAIFQTFNISTIYINDVDFDFGPANVLIGTVTLTPYKFRKTGFKSLSKVNQSYVNPFGLSLG